MRSIFILLFLLKMNISFAQTSALLGKWKVISVSEVISASRDSLFYDLEKDSIYIPAEDMEQANKDGHDSTYMVNLFKEIYGSLKKSGFTFQKDSVVWEFGGELIKGVYKVKNGTIDMVLGKDDDREHRLYTYFFKNDLLYISIELDRGYAKFVFRRE